MSIATELSEWRRLGQEFVKRYYWTGGKEDELAGKIQQLMATGDMLPEKELQAWQMLGRSYLKLDLAWDECNARREGTAEVCKLLGRPYLLKSLSTDDMYLSFDLPKKGVAVDPGMIIDGRGDPSSILSSGRKKVRGRFRVALIDDEDKIIAYGTEVQ